MPVETDHPPTSTRLNGAAPAVQPAFARPRTGPPLYQLLGLSALSAILLTLACPPYDFSWLAWTAPVPLFWALLVKSAPHKPSTFNLQPSTFWLGFTWGTVFLLLLAPWFAGFTPAGYPVAAMYWGLLAGLTFAAAGAAVRRTPGWAAAPVLAAAWVVLEWLRAQGTLAFPWGSLAVTQYRNLPVLQMLDLTGAFGLSFLMALPAAALACTQVPRLRSEGVRWAWGTGAVLAVSIARGASLLAAPAPKTETVRVGVVQASESLQAPGAAVVCVSPEWDYDARTREALGQGAELVVWPESAAVHDVVHDPISHARVEGLVRGTGASLLAGSFIRDPASGRTTNGAAMVAPDGRVLGQYAKVLIVPFGEYLPARPLLAWTTALGMPSDDLQAGRRWEPLPWARGKVGASICFESTFGSVSREMVKKGAGMLAILTSDGWAGRAGAGLQHRAFAPLRAVEERRSVARAAATGVSELIDPYGRVLHSLPMFTKGAAVGDLPLRSDRTLYSYLGDWPVTLAWGILLMALYPRRRLRERATRQERSEA